MFKLHRHRSDRFGEKVEIKFSNLQAIKVPRGWDKLLFSIVSVASGKTIARSGKATVRSGNCYWTETESVWVFQDETSRELEECQFKIVICPASARSSIIGEVTLNIADHLSSGDTGPLLLPLEKCDFGTSLQVKIQCCTPKSKFRAGKSWKETTSHLEDQNNNDELDSKLDGSDNMFNRSIGSSSSNHLGNSHLDEPGNRDTNFSASGSYRSSDSGDSLGKTNLSPKNSLNEGKYVGRQDSSGSHLSATYGRGPGDGPTRTNPSSFNSMVSSSSVQNGQWQDMTAQVSDSGGAPSLLRPSDSSKDLLEAAEEIEELRDEVKMWERHSRQLKLDIEALKKENSEKSKRQVNLDRDLSAACSERDSLKIEVEQLKAALKELTSKQTNIGSSRKEDMVHVQELAGELKFQKESNADLNQQLRKTQESNVELVAILQELEEITEKQRLEIANLSQQSCVDGNGQQNSQKQLDNQAELEREFLSSVSHYDLKREVQTLQDRIHELERDCAELLEENLDLIYKIKELGKDSGSGNYSHGFKSKEFQDQISSKNCKYENGLLKSQIYELEEELKMKEVMTATLSAKFKNLEKASADLEKELQHYKDDASEFELRLGKKNKELEEMKLELSNLRHNLEHDEETIDASAMRGSEEVDSFSLSTMQNILFEMDKQIRLALVQAKDLHSRDNCDADIEGESNVDNPTRSTVHFSQKDQVEGITRSLHELNALLRENIFRYSSKSLHQNSGTKPRSLKNSIENKECEDNIEDGLQFTLLLKEQDIDRRKCSNRELKDLISNHQKEKCQLEEDLASIRKENSEMSKILEDVELELEELTTSMEFHVSANKTLEKRSTELESCKNELEVHVSELEQENVQLSERISGLEAQLRYMTNDKESNRLELEDASSLVEYLKNEVEQQRGDMEMQKAETKQKLQELQIRLSEALQESDVSRRSNSKLQSTIESLIEECNSLQKLTADLKRQKLDMHEHIAHLEVELNESRKKNFDFCEQVNLLERKLSSLQKDIAFKEKILLSQLERLFQDNKEQEERIGVANIMLNKIELEKTFEIQNLEKEITQLTAQMPSSHDEREKLALDAVHEASVLRSDKARLEHTLQEVDSKVKLCEADLQTFQKESKDKIQGLVDLLNASKQSEEMLMADIEHMKRIMEGVKSSEEKHRKMVNDLELKHKASHFEKQQLLDEISGLKVQLQKFSLLQNSVLDLTSSLDEANCEKRKVEGLLKSVTEECEELKSEKFTLTDKISNMQKALCDGEDDKRSRIALQEKLLRLESDLSAKEASCANEAELKNELNRIKRTNSEYQRKFQNLEQENIELMKKVETLKAELMLRRSSQDEKVNAEGGKNPHDRFEVLQGNVEVNHQSETLLETEHTKSLEVNNTSMEQLKRDVSGMHTDEPEVLEKCQSKNFLEKCQSKNLDKVSSLEKELKDMQERYFNMSLQFAEVEAQREQLVMQLKILKKEKKWFS